MMSKYIFLNKSAIFRIAVFSKGGYDYLSMYVDIQELRRKS
jgi:hypothetical protein